MIWGLIIGIAVGVLFKPQIETAVVRVIKAIKDNTSGPDDKIPE
ncbi:MAG: hypothetical protein ACOC4I_01810 [Spirochaetota bacterium]